MQLLAKLPESVHAAALDRYIRWRALALGTGGWHGGAVWPPSRHLLTATTAHLSAVGPRETATPVVVVCLSHDAHMANKGK